MIRRTHAALALFFASSLVGSSAMAGAKIQINEDSSFDLGFRVQFLAISTQADLDGDGEWDSTQDMKARRARFRLKGVINEWAEGFLQTDISSAAGGSGRDLRVIDAWINLKASPWAQFFTGVNMAPTSRQNLTSSGALLAMDRPGMAYKSLSWGTRSLYAFSNMTLGPSDSGIRGEEDVRDAGITLFGSGEVGEDIHLKYYGAVNDGIQYMGNDDERFTGRVQLNFMDAEPGYFNSSTYLGKKRTIGVGVSYDMQSSVAGKTDSLGTATVFDYSLISADAFCEIPVGNASLTLEAGMNLVDFDVDASMDPGMDMENTLAAAQGTGFYVQGGVLLQERWQPWFEFESFASDGLEDAGSYSLFRVGGTYFIRGHNANIKLGLEQLTSETMLTMNSDGGGEDSIMSIVAGTYLTY